MSISFGYIAFLSFALTGVAAAVIKLDAKSDYLITCTGGGRQNFTLQGFFKHGTQPDRENYGHRYDNENAPQFFVPKNSERTAVTDGLIAERNKSISYHKAGGDMIYTFVELPKPTNLKFNQIPAHGVKCNATPIYLLDPNYFHQIECYNVTTGKIKLNRYDLTRETLAVNYIIPGENESCIMREMDSVDHEIVAVSVEGSNSLFVSRKGSVKSYGAVTSGEPRNTCVELAIKETKIGIACAGNTSIENYEQVHIVKNSANSLIQIKKYREVKDSDIVLFKQGGKEKMKATRNGTRWTFTRGLRLVPNSIFNFSNTSLYSLKAADPQTEINGVLVYSSNGVNVTDIYILDDPESGIIELRKLDSVNRYMQPVQLTLGQENRQNIYMDPGSMVFRTKEIWNVKADDSFICSYLQIFRACKDFDVARCCEIGASNPFLYVPDEPQRPTQPKPKKFQFSKEESAAQFNHGI